MIAISNEIKKLALTFTVFWAFLCICALFYYFYEGWTPSESIFFAVVTMTTVGYGYKYPKDDNSRLFTIFVMIFGVYFVFASINDAVVTRLKKIRKQFLKNNTNATPAELYKVHQQRLALTITFIVVFLFIAAGIFCAMEKWSFIQSLYFVVQTATTVGFGDLDLKAGGTNIVLGIYIMLSTILIFFAFNNFSTLHQDFKQIKVSTQLAEKHQTLDKLKELDTGNGVSMDTFILAVLEQVGTIDREKDIEPWIKKFRALDRNNSGTIHVKEIEEFSQAEALRASEQIASMQAVTSNTVFQNALSPLIASNSTNNRGRADSVDDGDVRLQNLGLINSASTGYNNSTTGGQNVNQMHALYHSANKNNNNSNTNSTNNRGNHSSVPGTGNFSQV